MTGGLLIKNNLLLLVKEALVSIPKSFRALLADQTANLNLCLPRDFLNYSSMHGTSSSMN
jgi:hypothetical protein